MPVPQALVSTPEVLLDPLSYSLSRYQATIFLSQLATCPCPSLTHLTLRHCSLTSVPPPLLARAVARLTSFTALWVELSHTQVPALFTALADPSSRLRHLSLSDYYGTEMVTRLEVEPDTLARALASLETLTYSCHLPPQFWRLLAEGEARLRRITVPRRFAIECPAEDLASALNNLEQLDFEKDFSEDSEGEFVDCFNSEQVIKVFEKMSKNTKLKKVTVEISEENILNHLELIHGLFAEALSNVEEVKIIVKNEVHFNSEITHLFHLLGLTANYRLRKLWLSVDSQPAKFKLDPGVVSQLDSGKVQEIKLDGDIKII